MSIGVSIFHGWVNVPLPFFFFFFWVFNDNISVGVVCGIALVAVLWLCNILALYVFKICVNDFGYFTSLVLLNCRDKV